MLMQYPTLSWTYYIATDQVSDLMIIQFVIPNFNSNLEPKNPGIDYPWLSHTGSIP